MNTKQTRPTRAASRTPTKKSPIVGRAGGVRVLLIVLFVSLLIVGQLIPCDSVAVEREGHGVAISMLWMMLLMVWALAVWRQFLPAPNWDRTTLAVGVFLLLLIVVTLIKLPSVNSRQAVNVLWQWITLASIFFLARQLLVSACHARVVIVIMASMAGGVAVWGYYESLVSFPARRAEYFQMSDSEKATFHQGMNVYAPPGSAEAYLVRNRIQSMEPTVTFALTNSLAGFLAPWLVVWLGISWQRFSEWRNSAKSKDASGSVAAWLAPLLMAVLLLGCVFMTKSRSATLGIVAGTGLLLLYIGRANVRLVWKVGLCATALAAVVLRLVWYLGRLDGGFVGEAIKSLTYRMEYWRSTASMIGDNLWTGCGLGNFQDLYARYKLPSASETVADPHNFILEVLATGGLFVFLGLVVLAITFVRQLMTGAPFKEDSPHDRERAPWIHVGGILGLLVAIGLASLLANEMSLPLVAVCGLALIIGGVIFHRWAVGDYPIQQLAIVGLFALLVELLASSGSLSFGVGQSVWLLMALALGRPTPASGDSNRRQPVPRALIAVLAVGVCVNCMVTTYMPVTLSRGYRFAAQTRPSPQARMDELRKAARSDKLDPRPWRGLAELQIILWNRMQSENLWREFESSVEELTRRDPISYSTSDQVGMWYLLAHQATSKKAHLERAHAFLLKSSVSNSSSSIPFARLAWVCDQLGRKADASQAASEALRLDELNPHIERSLKRQLLFLGIPGSKEYSHSRLGGEQLIETLRKMTNSEN